MTPNEHADLAALLHKHWMEDSYVSDGEIFASCACGEHIPIPAVTVEDRDPVVAFSEHVAASLAAAGVRMIEETGLREAWAAVEAALPAGNRDIGFTVMFNPRTRKYEAWSWHWDSPPGDVWTEKAETPAAALSALAAVLRINLATEDQH